MKAILLSGGMDSIALAYWKKPDIAITINYGQSPGLTEIRSSKAAAESMGISHYVLDVDCSPLGSGDLVNKTALNNSPSSEWWPYRNQLLVTLACMKGISLGVTELMVASVKSDGFHKDGTSEFYEYITQLMQFQEGNIKIAAPCITLTTVELIKKSNIPKELLFWAHSCHSSNIACGKCRGCHKYQEVLRELNYFENEESHA